MAERASETTRQAYYGDGLQPWDLIKSLGMGADFCAGNVIKYVGRYNRKNGLDDLEKASWYLARLIELKKVEAANGVRREGDSGFVGSVRQAADNDHGDLSPVHSRGDSDASGSGPELGQ